MYLLLTWRDRVVWLVRGVLLENRVYGMVEVIVYL